MGYLHEFIGCQTKQSLVYDLQEPFSWLADVAVMDAFESGVLDLPDFYFTGDEYRYRFELQAKQRFLDLLRERFNSVVRYKGRALKWDTVIEEKTVELGRFLFGKSLLDFGEPSPRLPLHDGRHLRERILVISSSDANQLGITKSTLHYLRKNAQSGRPFRTYGKVLCKVQREE